MSRRLPRRISAAAILLASCLPAAEHQGIVKFGGLPLPGATVTASQDGKRVSAITDQQGSYVFTGLQEGSWTVKVEMQCFVPQQREIAVSQEAAPADWELKLFSCVEPKAPTAAAAAPAPSGASTAASSRKSKKAPRQPANTPAGFRHTEANASSTPEKQAGEPSPVPSEFNQAPADGFLINGSVNNSADSIFAQAAAFGNFRKGQRSLYNGGLGFILDNSAFDARSFSLTGQKMDKPSYNHMQGVLSFGGPLKIPHLIQGNGPIIVINYQWLRNRNANTRTGRMPSQAERDGDFSGMAAGLYDPAGNAPFPGNRIPYGRISPQAAALLSLYPLPNFDANARYNYQIPVVGSTHQDSLQTRFNKGLGRKNQISGNFAYQSTRSDNSSIFGFLDTNQSAGVNTAISWMHRFNQRVFGTLGYQYSRLDAHVTPFFAGRENVSGIAGITGNNQEPVNWGPPNLSFSSGISGLSDVQRSVTRNQTSGVSTSLFWGRVPHNITLGADFKRQQFNPLAQQDPRGSFTFTGASTQGSDFAGFLLGIPDTSSIAFGNADKYLRASSYAAYFTDDWRVSPGLTVNMGLRWEYNSPITERYGRLVNLDVAPGFGAVTPVIGASLRPDRNGLEPRLGLSWRPFLASSMVVRAGYGVYYNTAVYLPIATQMAQQPPLSKTLAVQNSAANPLTLANGFNAAPGVTLNTFAVDPNFRAGYSQNWQVSIQGDLPAAMVLTATYLGIKGTRAPQQFLPNTYPAGAVSPCSGCPSGFAYMASNGNSTRESGQIQLRRRLQSGLSAQIQYTYSKSIDNAALGGRGEGTIVIAQDWLNLRGERGPSDFDQRHLLNLQMQYTTGMGLAGGTLAGGWKGRLFKDWTFGSQINAGSGLPLTPVYLAPVRGTGITGSIRPDYTGAPLYNAPPGQFLNPAAVAPPSAGHWGNAGRNSITGPSQFSLLASIARTFRVTDRISADLRIDSANALNHPVFGAWNTTVNSTQFGLPTGANPMRTVQTTLRVRF